MSIATDYLEYLIDQLNGIENLSYKLMFGGAMIYADRKAIFNICDNTCFCKVLPETTLLLGESNEKRPPYTSAKPAYVVDTENRELFLELANALIKVTPDTKRK